MILLLAGCIPTPSAPAPTKAPIVGYVISRSGDISQTVAWLDVATCSQRPTSYADVGKYCDLSTAQIVQVEPEQVLSYHGGDAYPHTPGSSPLPDPSYAQ